ncbi:UNVERIFIED_CONTAM: hypothetical protein RMT77_016002 [Armadillidium vulgare]
MKFLFYFIGIYYFANIYPCYGLPNTPPQITFDREWTLTEDEPVGSVVTRIRVHDSDKDDVKVSIGRPSSEAFQGRLDGASFFEIDKHKRVVLKKSLKGLAGESFLVGIIATDGHIPNRIDARVTIRYPNESAKFMPFGFAAALMPSPLAPTLPNPYDHEQPLIGPPLLHLDPFTVWTVLNNASIGSVVTVVEAQNLRPTQLTFSVSPQTLLHIDPKNGRVTTAKTLLEEVGNHTFIIEVSDQVESISEEVVLRVLPNNGTSSLIRNNYPHPHPHPHPPFYPKDNLEPQSPTHPQDTHGHHTVTTDLPPDDSVKSPTEKGYSGYIILGIAIVFGVFLCCGVLLWQCWKRHNKKAGKESSVTYSEKGNNSSIRTEVSRTDSLFNELFSLVGIRKRAESNGYEEGVPNIPIRESRKSSRVSNVSSGTEEEADKWEFPRHKVRVLEILGEGCFGQVWKCDAMDLGVKGRRTVAVKTLKESAGQAEQNDLMQELKVLKSLSYHPNVVSLLGCCTEKEPIFVILEYMVGGKLQSYLRSSRANGHPYDNLHGVSSSLTPRDLTIFALQTAKGMDFLSQNGIIHRDLAARNVLVGDNKICKVADFGFARDVANNHIYERKSDGRLPIRWMAPESLFDNIFTTKSDVWSFGVLLWEIVTLGSTPYPGRSAVDVMKRVKDGYRLEKPDHCKREIYNIMFYCWDADQRQRPSFSELVKSLEALILTEVDYIQLENFPDHNYYNFTSVSTSSELL